MEQLRVVGWLGCQHKLLTRSRSVQWHVTVWPCWINTNFIIEDEHVLVIQFLREIRSYSDAINSYELYCHTSTFCLCVIVLLFCKRFIDLAYAFVMGMFKNVQLSYPINFYFFNFIN